VTAHGIQVGLVSNGTKLIEAVDALSQCTWIGVSVDSATPATFNRLKGLPAGSTALSRIAENIAILMDYAKKHHKRLGRTHPSYGLSYKYLLYDRDNIGEMYQAAKLAK
jgi:wyosine [tRNA(Phe)-imidazoG37] synthetase (radical SAM superfamily)